MRYCIQLERWGGFLRPLWVSKETQQMPPPVPLATWRPTPTPKSGDGEKTGITMTYINGHFLAETFFPLLTSAFLS